MEEEGENITFVWCRNMKLPCSNPKFQGNLEDEKSLNTEIIMRFNWPRRIKLQGMALTV